MRWARPTMRGLLRIALVLPVVLLGAISSVAYGKLIVQNEFDGLPPAFTLQAYDAAVSPPGSVQQKLVSPQIPGSGTETVSDGFVFSRVTYSFTDAELRLDLKQSRDGLTGSYTTAVGTVGFVPQYDLHYESSATETGSETHYGASVYLLMPRGNDATLLQENEQNGSHNASGTLFSGTTYALYFNYAVSGQGMPDNGAQVSGSVDLTFFLLGDLNGDRSIGFDDLITLARHYGATDATYEMGDIDGDGTVGFNDLVLLARNYGLGIPAASAMSAAVPEPQIAALLLLAGLLLRRYGRKLVRK